MNKTHLTALTAVVLAVRWLAGVHVPVAVFGGAIVTVPALALAALALIAVAAGLVALLVWRTRAEQAMLAAWQAGKAATS
jgi:hypothetical protein